MRTYLLTLISVLLCADLFAVPAQRQQRRLTLADGTTVVATLCGDEHYHWWQTADGQVLEEVEGMPSRYVRSQATAEEAAARGIALRAKAAAPQRIGSQATAPLPATGSPKVPVVLVNFQDSVFHVADTDEGIREYYDRYCNGTRDGQLYKGHGSYGAIRDYFAQQSDSIFMPEFVIIGPVTLDHPEEYYGANGSGKDSRYSEFRNHAIAKATQLYDGDWMDFDNRGLEQVDMVFFIFAGCGEANGGPSTTIWPKESTGSITLNGIKFATSACCNENRGRTDENGNVIQTKPDGIGIMCHELSHALGLPDFYDTRSNATAFGMDLWSLMDYGCHADNGATPCAYTAYERDFMGWRSMQELTEWGSVTLASLEADGVGMKIVNDENANEYYVLENRQPIGWDSSVGSFGHGLQVTHVDYDATRWRSNNVNTDPTHQRMTIIAANNLYYGTSNPETTSAEMLINTWKGNMYPFVGYNADGNHVRNDSLTANSTPAATVYTAAGYLGKNLYDIHEHGANLVSFYFGNNFVVGIDEANIAPVHKPQAAFDLMGRRVATEALPAGIYVIGGRKVVIK